MRSFFSRATTRQRRKVGTGIPIIKGNVSPIAIIPKNIKYPEYALTQRPYTCKPTDMPIYDPIDFPQLRAAGKLARKMLDYANSLVVPGVTTDYIDRLVCEEIIKHGAYPSPVNYYGFPKAICTSVNEVVCHGIPDDRILQDGDILSIDVSIYLNGFHGDNCGTVIVGNNGRDVDKKLMYATQESLNEAIKILRPGVCLSSIGATIQHVAASHGFNVVQEFCGHGTGKYLHMPPLVRHHINNDKFPLVKGMVFTIEPILVEGSRHIEVWQDEWTAVTEDGGHAAQFEHEVLIHDDGAEILTVPI